MEVKALLSSLFSGLDSVFDKSTLNGFLEILSARMKRLLLDHLYVYRCLRKHEHLGKW